MINYFTKAKINNKAARLTYAELYKVLPFGNTIVAITITGEQIRAALEQHYDPTRSRPQLILGVSAGFGFDYHSSGSQGNRIHNVTVNGTPIDMAKNYQVTVGDYMAGGGDSFTVFKQGKNPMGGGSDLEVLKAYIKQNSPVSPPSVDRIKMLQ
jgi:5'-nucleotidase